MLQSSVVLIGLVVDQWSGGLSLTYTMSKKASQHCSGSLRRQTNMKIWRDLSYLWKETEAREQLFVCLSVSVWCPEANCQQNENPQEEWMHSQTIIWTSCSHCGVVAGLAHGITHSNESIKWKHQKTASTYSANSSVCKRKLLKSLKKRQSKKKVSFVMLFFSCFSKWTFH